MAAGPIADPASAALPDAALGGGGSDAVAGATTAPLSVPAALEAVQAALANLQNVLNGGVSAGGIIPGGEPALVGGAAAAPMPESAVGMAPMQDSAATGGGHGAAGHHDAKAGAKGNKPKQHPKKHGGLHITNREKPEDRALAQRNLEAVMSLSGTQRSQLDFKNNKTHGYLRKDMQERFRRQFPGLPVPQSLVFESKGNKPIGVAYRVMPGDKFDLGMGTQHTHPGQKSMMQHIWFTPQDLDFAFTDVQHGGTGGTAKKMRQRGFI